MSLHHSSWAVVVAACFSQIYGRAVSLDQFSIVNIAHREQLHVDEYKHVYEAKLVPVIITDYGSKVVSKGGLSLKRISGLCGEQEVVPLILNNSSTRWAKMDPAKAMAVRQYLKYFKQEIESPSNAPLNMMDWVLKLNCAPLGRTLMIPKYVARDVQKITDVRTADSPWPSLFMSPSTLQGSGLHIDSGNSSFWMYVDSGKKRWRIVHAKHIYRLGPRDILGMESEYLDADLFAPDFDRFPGLRGLDVWEADLDPGELIIVPSGFAHQVQNLVPSIAIAGNFINPSGIEDHRSFLRFTARRNFGSDESDWPEQLRILRSTYGHANFKRAADSVLPTEDIAFDVYHAGLAMPKGWRSKTYVSRAPSGTSMRLLERERCIAGQIAEGSVAIPELCMNITE